MQTPETLIRFDRLRERLLQGGVARRHVKRTLAELRDHYDDAIDDGLAQGIARDTATWSDRTWSCGVTPAQMLSIRPRRSKLPIPSSRRSKPGCETDPSAAATSSAT